MSGKLIVFEGTDGSGKATQTGMLCDDLAREGISYRRLTFPRYGKPSAAALEEYLRGDLGKRPEDVNAYASSLMFAVDRYASYKQDWGEYYRTGGLIVADRYTTSNAVHQASKLPDGERKAYLNWLFDLEYRLLELPAPDLVIFLDMPVEISRTMMNRREVETSTHSDIHEQDAEYQRRSHDNAEIVAGLCGWNVIRCSLDGAPRTPEDIHREVMQLVRGII